VSQNESISSLVIVFNETTKNRTTYRCIARNSLGSTLSEEATLTVARREARGRFQRVRQFLIFTPNNTGTYTFIITVRRKYLTNVTVFTLKYIYVIHRPHNAGGIWKRRFISAVRPTVRTNPSRKRSFSKTLFKPEESENAGFSHLRRRKAFWKRSFSKTMALR